jgi:hypothetical protein
VTFPESGTDEDLHEAYLQEAIDSRLRHGMELIGQAKFLVAYANDSSEAEPIARKGLAALASALNWAEDSPREDETHQQMDAAGRWVRTTFGCLLHRDGTSYSITCPVRLGHNRSGMSIGGYALRLCSLCGQDVSECEHRPGIAYLVPGGSDELGWCRVCGRESACEHTAEQTYRVSLVSIVVDGDLDEISFVDKPAQPDARITSISVSAAELQQHLGPAWRPGMPVNCDYCLTPCRGLVRPHFGQSPR